jgi:hypothetical protein
MKLIEKITQYTDKKFNEINKILNPKNEYKLKFVKKGKNKLISIIKDDKTVLTGQYNFFGIYQPSTKLWIWASSIPGVDMDHIKNIRKIKQMDHIFESHDELNFYYQLLTQDVVLINDEKLLEKINEVLLYLSNDLYYFNPENSEGNIQFITLSNIKEKYV